MNVLGNYSIDITTNQAYVSKAILPFFCSNNATTPSLDAYFLNITPRERLEVMEKLSCAITNLSGFDVVHFIKSNCNMMQIKNQGKAFLQSNSKVKKIVGTIISINQTDAMELNGDPEKIEGEPFELELLLNNFIKKQKQKAADAKVSLFLKMDVNLPKYIIGLANNITAQLQAALNEIIHLIAAIEELTLTVKLIRENKTDFTVNFALEYNSKQTTFYSFDTQFKTTEDHQLSSENKDGSNHAPQANIKILLAEDHKMNQIIAINLLKKEFKGVEIDVAENGLAAFEMTKNNNYDLILMDIDMPVLNGIEATKKIRTELKSNLPILGFSAHVFQNQIQKCFVAGMNDFIAKPVNVNSLRLKVKNALNNAKTKSKPAILKNLYCDLDNTSNIAV